MRDEVGLSGKKKKKNKKNHDMSSRLIESSDEYDEEFDYDYEKEMS